MLTVDTNMKSRVNLFGIICCIILIGLPTITTQQTNETALENESTQSTATEASTTSSPTTNSPKTTIKQNNDGTATTNIPNTTLTPTPTTTKATTPTPKIDHDGTCTETDECSTIGAACTDTKCQCSKTHYYSSNGNICKPKISHSGNCNETYQCSTVDAVCNNHTCQCNNIHYFDITGNICKQKIDHDGTCNDTKQCSTTDAVCTDTKCQCNRTHYYSVNGNICKPKINHDGTCNDTKQCSTTDAVCTETKCQCNRTHYYSVNGNICKPKISYDGDCTKPEQCSTTNATCSDGGKCQCTNDNYHSVVEDMCKQKIAHNGNCSKQEQCSTTGATCSDGGKCICTNDNYYSVNEDMCKQKIGYNQTCETKQPHNQCESEGAQCINGSCSCGDQMVYTSDGLLKDSCDDDSVVCDNRTDTCVSRPNVAAFPNVYGTSTNYIQIGWNISTSHNHMIRIKRFPPDEGMLHCIDNPVLNSQIIDDLIPGTFYSFLFYIKERCIPTNDIKLTEYTVPEIGNLQLKILRTTEHAINAEFSPDASKHCEKYEFKLTSPSSNEQQIINVTWTNATSYNETFTNLTGASQYTLTVTALAGRHRSKSSKTTKGYTRPPPVNTAKITYWSNSSLVVNVNYDGSNSTDVTFCYIVAEKITGDILKSNASCFLNTSDAMATLQSLQPGTEYNVNVYSYFHGRSESSFNLTSWTRPQNLVKLEVISRTKTSFELQWMVTNAIDAETVVVEIYNDLLLLKTYNDTPVHGDTSGTIIIPDLEAGTEYKIKGYTVIDDDMVLSSEENYTISEYTRPSVPNVTVISQEEQSIRLKITCDSDCDQILVMFEEEQNTTVDIDETTGEADITGLTPGTNYTLGIYSLISGVESENSTTIHSFTKPGPPEKITFPLDTLEEESLIVKWDSPTEGNADSFVLNIQNGSVNKTENVLTSNNLVYNASGLTAGTQYTVTIITVWRGLRSTRSITGTIHTRPSPPSVSVYKITHITTSTITISLNASQQPYESISFINENNDKNQTYAITFKTFDIDNLAVGTKYNFSVYSIIAGISSRRFQTLISYTLPGKVTNISRDFNKTNSSALSVQWTQPGGDVDKYIVNATCSSPNTESEMETQWNSITPDNSPVVMLTPLDPGTTCIVNVTALINNTDYQTYSPLLGEVTVTSEDIGTREAAPGEVESVSMVPSNTSLSITWTPPKTPNGIIRKYKIVLQDDYDNCIKTNYEYTTVTTQHTESSSDQTYTCLSTNSRNILDNCSESSSTSKLEGTNSILVSELHPYRNYSVKIKAYTRCFGEEYTQTEQTHIGSPSTSPRNFKYHVTDSTISLTWDALDPYTDGNGPILNYAIRKTYINNSCSDSSDGHLITNELTSPNPNIIVDSLRSFWRYSVSVKALTSAGEGPWSDCKPNACNILTAESKPEASRDQTVKPLTTSADVSWSPPCKTNGIITSYRIVINNTDTEIIINDTSTTDNTTHIQIPGLLPYSNYTVQVAASTSAGQGPFAKNVDFRTLVDKPGKPRNVSAVVDQTVATTLNVKWTKPDLYTGPTHYTVTATDTVSKDIKTCKTGVDFNATGCDVQGLDAYWNYTITVQSITTAGNNMSDKIRTTTGETAPGIVQTMSLTAEQNITAPRSISVSWEPPSERDLNGVIINYFIIVDRTNGLNGDTSEVQYTAKVEASERTKKLTNNILPGNYTISVLAATKAGNGTLKQNKIFVLPGAPIIVKENSTNLLMKPNPDNAVADKEKQISINLPLEDFLCANTNGKLTKWGIMVVSEENYQQNKVPYIGSKDDFFKTKFKTWFGVKDQDSYDEYQATPNDWDPKCSENTGGKRHRRSAVQAYKPFTIGSDGDCSGKSPSSYCNGALKPDHKYRVKSYACTDTGCAETRYSEPISTAPAKIKEPKFDFVPVIAGVVAAIIVVGVIAGVILMKRRQMACFNKDVEGTSTHKPGDSINMDDVGAKPEKKNAHRFVPGPVKLADFPEYVKNMHKDTDLLFADAYKMLKENSPSHSLNAAEQQCSRPKNRYTNILPFDHSRVKLRPSDDIEGSDYINANYIPGYTSKREYIATQGPMPATFDDFWRMVWEQNVDTIVMLTKLMENGRRKCDLYWPELGEPVFYGDLVVSIQSESNLSDYTLRLIEVKMDNTVKVVHQFCYLKWPDMGCPEKTDLLLQFVKEVRQYAKPERASTSGPIIVHCSAGVGRTGTFIAVDHLLQHIRDHDDIDVYKLVVDMRNHRLNMVQTEDQFIYIHECINSFISTDEDMEEDEEPLYENTGVLEENVYENTAFNDQM